MKRKRTDKMTSAELLAAGFPEMAGECRRKLHNSITLRGRHPFSLRHQIPATKKYLKP